MVGSKNTVFALFFFVFEGNFPSTIPRGAIFAGAYPWRGLFSELYGISHKRHRILTKLHTKLGSKDHIA